MTKSSTLRRPRRTTSADQPQPQPDGNGARRVVAISPTKLKIETLELTIGGAE